MVCAGQLRALRSAVLNQLESMLDIDRVPTRRFFEAAGRARGFAPSPHDTIRLLVTSSPPSISPLLSFG